MRCHEQIEVQKNYKGNARAAVGPWEKKMIAFRGIV